MIKCDKSFVKKLDFKDIKFPVKIRDMRKIEKRIILTEALLIMKTRKKTQFIYQKIYY